MKCFCLTSLCFLRKNYSTSPFFRGFDYLLCTLKHDSIFNVALDYELDLGEELDLFINGKGTVYLTGYLRLENDPPEDWQDFDGDGEAESVGSDDNMFLDSEDDDDDKEDEEEEEDSDDEIITTQVCFFQDKQVHCIHGLHRMYDAVKPRNNGFGRIESFYSLDCVYLLLAL